MGVALRHTALRNHTVNQDSGEAGLFCPHVHMQMMQNRAEFTLLRTPQPLHRHSNIYTPSRFCGSFRWAGFHGFWWRWKNDALWHETSVGLRFVCPIKMLSPFKLTLGSVCISPGDFKCTTFWETFHQLNDLCCFGLGQRLAESSEFLVAWQSLPHNSCSYLCPFYL